MNYKKSAECENNCKVNKDLGYLCSKRMDKNLPIYLQCESLA